MFIDEVEIILSGGHGGPGRVSFLPGKKSGPDGGNGGKGGDVYITVTPDLLALNRFSRETLLLAEDGEMGGKNNKTGAAGKDLEIPMPIGTTLIDLDSGEGIELDRQGERILICEGGKRGKGNFELRSPKNTTPMVAQPGLPGEKRRFKVILKLIADFGLIGLPNAGKSSLLNELTKANVKTAEYPFTTLEPNLGVFEGKVLADIPGLIAGASEGKGLGIKFLKHIEKVKVLLHCITADSEDVVRDYETVMEELNVYNPEVVGKQQIIFLTKTDLVRTEVVKEKITQLKKFKKMSYPVSIYDWDSIQRIKKVIHGK